MMKKNQRITKRAAPPVGWYRISEEQLARMMSDLLEQAKTKEIPVSPIVSAEKPHLPVDYKKIRVLLCSGMPDEDWRSEQIAADELRRLVKEVITIKARPSFGMSLSLLNPDLIVYMGRPDGISQEDLGALQGSPAVKAVWLADNEGTSEALGRAAAFFEHVFTQHTVHIPFYQSVGCRRVSHLPFSSDPELYYPKPFDEDYRSDLLIIGDSSKHLYCFKSISKMAEGLKIKVICSDAPSLELAALETFEWIREPSPVQTANYYNGAGAIIHLEPQVRQVIEAAACGAFQLASVHPDLYEYMCPGEDVVIYHSLDELEAKLIYYLDHPDQRRVYSSRALGKSRYDYSYLQMVSRLLYAVFLP